MPHRLRWAVTTCALALLLPVALAAAPSHADPRVPTEDDARNKVAAHGRTLDQMTNPDFLARQAAVLDDCVAANRDVCMNTDPYRLDWAGRRGDSLAVTWDNRYGQPIVGHLWAPAAAARAAAGRGLPAVLVVNGSGAIEQMYWGLAQGLAEAGYLVLTFDPQCHGGSGCDWEDDPEGKAKYCDTDGTGPWRQPQEMGVREKERCAGVPASDDTPEEIAAFGVYGAGCLSRGECDQAQLVERYRTNTTTQVLGALDAVDWLLSDRNPWRPLVDPSRVGIAGHSYGSQAALLAGNGDPLDRFAAAVSWDGYGVLPDTVSPRIPTLFQRADQDEFGARTQTPDAEASTPLRNARQFVEAGVPTGHVALGGGSTHQEWAYTPAYGAAFAGQSVASRDGERVALHYTLAWFDRFLGGPARHARERLVAPAFDDAVDRSSIGQGTYDALTRSNVPYTIGGETTQEHLSQLYPSWISLPEIACGDLRNGCARRGRPHHSLTP